MTMNKKMIRRVGGLALVALAAVLSACGGGGSDAGCSVFSTSCTTTTTTTTGGGTDPTSAAGTVALSLSADSLTSSAPVTVTALVKNGAGELVAGTVVNFTVANGAATPVPQRVVTDAKGVATTVLQASASGSGGDYVVAVADITSTQTATTRAAFTVVADPNASSAAGSVALSMGNTTISTSLPGTATAFVKKADGKALANTMVTFAVANGSATVSPLRVLTDAQGYASTTLKPVAGASGADYVTATADLPAASAGATSSVTARTPFTVSPSAVSSSSDVAGTMVLRLSNNTISSSSPGTVTALLKNADGTALVDSLVTFGVTNASAGVSPLRVKTNELGEAVTTLQPLAGAVGADYVTASADLPNAATLSTRVVFTVSPTSVQLAGVSANPASLAAYGSSVVSVSVVGASSASPITVNFSSSCVAAGRAVLSPSSVTVTGSTASTTYQDKGCSTTDLISAVISGTAQQRQINLAVAGPVAQALEFVAASPDKICLAGSGCEVSSVVSFRLKDQNNSPVAGREVSFSLDIPNVATISPTTYKTNEQGIAQVSVTSRTIPSPVRVRADVTLDDGSRLSTVSNVLAINAGLPTQRAFSFSAAAYNPDGWARDGTESDIRVQLTDRFANPVPDGTSISFVAEGASIIPARCTTANGICNVKFVTSNFRPTNGRVTVVAFAQGEESFDDADGDNKYTTGENFTDLGQVFIDKDENGQMAAAGEYHIGEAGNGVWGGNTLVRVSRVFTLSDSSRAPRLFAVNGDGSCSTTVLPYQTLSLTAAGACRLSTRFCMRDANTAADALGGNPVPANATLTLATKAKGGTVSVDASPVTGIWTGPTTHTVTADLDDCTKPLEAGGPIDLTVKMPNGQSYKFDIGVLQ
jgi:Bacterial Ig-like domain (group 1)